MRCQSNRLALGLLILIGARSALAAEDYAFYHENVMGTSLELRVRADSEAAANRAEAAVLGEIDRLAAIFSSYESESEFSRWQRMKDRPVMISAELFSVLKAADAWRAKSNGAFDPRVQALTRLWSSSAKAGRTPTYIELTQVLGRMKRDAWSLDESTKTARSLSDCPLTLNAIAKGYIVERAAELANREVRGVLLNVGGDIRACGETLRVIGIADPNRDSESTEPIAFLQVRDRSVATSGSYQRGLWIEGTWYSHIFDPRTGRPVATTVSATVVAERGVDADALATLFNVLSIDESLALAKSLPNVECLLVTAEGRVAKSPGWGKYEAAAPVQLTAADPRKSVDQPKPNATGSAWNPDFELAVKFEITTPPEGSKRVRRPYVAIWVEDEAGFPVRTLLLWVRPGGNRWYPDLRHWYRSDQTRRLVDKTDMFVTTARATRPGGSYEVVWDGKDDHGKPIPPGKYTLYIEAVRERGTYQSIREPLTLGDSTFTKELKGNVEIKSASIESRRKSKGK